ncbi:MAG: tRNA dihydrouridine synthase DusB, partial [Gemmatimonadetes bacterium]|nr:tRNA dihydrouridine synthase DusB [Gemmatimonadota bacterium]
GRAGGTSARGSHGAPWTFRDARAALAGLPVPPAPTVGERVAIVLEHAHIAVAFEADEPRAVREFRKHLGWYTKRLPESRALREELFRVDTLAEAELVLRRYRDRHELVAA